MPGFHENRTVLITGGYGGIGQALVEAYLAAGVRHVLVAGREGRPQPVGCSHVPLDVTDPASAQAAADAFGDDVDILVNNAGVNRSAGLFDPNAVEALTEEFRVNALGTMNMFRAFAEPMAKREGSLFVNILSVLSLRSVPAMASYCASKAAAFSIAQSARVALEPRGIKLLSVFPKMVDTPMSAQAQGTKMAPADLAQAILAASEKGEREIYP